MADPVKFSGTTPTQPFVRNKNFYVGTEGDYGPTSSTGFYAGITPPGGGYTLYRDKASQGPSIRVFETSTSLSTELSRSFGGPFQFENEGIVSASLADDICVLNREVPNIPSSSTLQYYWDANLSPSSVSGSTRIFSMGKNESEGTMSSELYEYTGPSGTSGSWGFDGTTTSIVTDLTSNTRFTDTFSVAMWVKIPTTGSGDFLLGKNDGEGLSHNGISIELSTANIVGTEYASWLVTIDGETEFYTRTLASVFPYNAWNLLVWSFEDRRDTFWLGQLGTPNEVTYFRDNSITNITATNPLTFGKNADLSQDYLSGSIGMVAIFEGKFDAESVRELYINTKDYFLT